MLRLDTNQYIQVIYDKSLELHDLQENGGREDEVEEAVENQEDAEERNNENEDDKWERMRVKCEVEAKQTNNAVYKDLKARKASDIYIFENDPKEDQEYLTHKEEYIQYPRREHLLEAIKKAMIYQDQNQLIDFHPSINDLSGELKEQVNKEMKSKIKRTYYHHQNPQNNEEQVSQMSKLVKIRNIIHQSLQSYHPDLCTSIEQDIFDEYFLEQGMRQSLIDQWGKQYKSSPSCYLWLPAIFEFNIEKNCYENKGKMFEHLEKWEGFNELKDEISSLLTYFAPSLKSVHNSFKEYQYQLFGENNNFGSSAILDIKKQVSFDKNIHAIVKISEIEIQPHSVYSGQWHVEGFSSDNVLYTCLYIIEQDERLTDGRLKFKRASRNDDVPSDPYSQPQSAHSYCPSYDFLCDPKKLIPLGSLDIKQGLMIIFPNQNIHKIKGISNNTDLPLKRKIIALFVVNHEDQPLTLNDVTFTKDLTEIKNHRLRDMYERSKNKQTDTQAFNYCEH